MYSNIKIILLTLLGLLCLITTRLFCQSGLNVFGNKHELIVFAIPSVVCIDWTSPATLSATAEKSFMLSDKCEYALGHMFIQLISPLLEEDLYAGMAVKSRKGLEIKVLRDKIGLGILGVENEGFLENSERLKQTTALHIKKNKINALKIRISEKAADRIIKFVKKFDSSNEFGYKPSAYYGGVFWPLYENEGAGCSAFAMAILNLAGFSMEELEKWRIDVKIPMELVGGEFNNRNKVRFGDVKAAGNWYEGDGKKNIDFIEVSAYDPSLLYTWINSELSGRKHDGDISRHKKMNHVPALELDYSDKIIDESIPIFSQRPERNVFMDHFFSKHKIKN